MRISQEDILSTGNLELLARHAVEGFITGFHRSPFHGFSVEFAEHRQYNAGESIKNIDWKLYGRSDKLFVKRFEEETNLRCRIVIDASSSMQYQGGATLNKMQYSIWCAAVILQMLKKQRDASGVDLFDETIFESSPMASSGRHYKELMLKLNSHMTYASSLRKTDLPTVIHLLAQKMHRRSMLIIFTDLLSHQHDEKALFDAIQHLKHNKQEVLLFNPLHLPTELDLDYGDQAVTFKDLETGEQIRLQTHQVREQYSARMKEHLHQLKLKCAQYKVDYIPLDTSKSVDQAIVPFLLKRNRMTR